METHETPLDGDEELRAEMSTSDINDLPDSDFAYIESGGEKDDSGKTVPRSLRHFPIHDAAHVRNALARAPQSPFGDKALPKIKAAAKKFGIDVADDNRTNPALVAAERRKKQRHRSVQLLPEVRHMHTSNLEVRDIGGSGDSVEITGMPCVYDTAYEVRDSLGVFSETMAPGVASGILDTADVRFLIDHDPSRLLARTVSGTLRLSDSSEGLRMAATVDLRDSDARNLMVRLERGDVSQMSCGFVVGRDEWSEDWDQRTIYRFDELLDVSAVTYPASPTTEIGIARRMALQAPIESHARLDRAYRDLRAGKVLSSANTEKVLSAVGALHDVLSGAGVDLASIGADSEPEPDVNVSEDGTQGGNDTAESGVGADGFPVDQTRSADLIANEEGEPITHFSRSQAAVDQAWLESLIERGEGVHGEARKRAA